MKTLQVHGTCRSRSQSLLLMPVLASVMLLSLGASTASAAPSSVVFNIAKYAEATAVHDRPAHPVTRDDVSNAAATPMINPPAMGSSKVSLTSNLGDLPGYPRVAVFVNPATYSVMCVNFPDFVGAAPTVATCSPRALGAWFSAPTVLLIARDAVAIAAQRGQAVSGADVVKVTSRQRWSHAGKPTFRSGQGGVVRFTNTSTSGPKGSTMTVNITVCVQFPTTAYGIPVLVKC
jgi:hypothetical protein